MTEPIELAERRRQKAREGWKSALLKSRTKSGELKLRRCVANVVTILRNDDEWKDVIAFDRFRHAIVKVKPAPWHEYDAPADSDPGAWTDADSTRTGAWLSRYYDTDFNSGAVNEGVIAVAEGHSRHDVRAYLNALAWDGTARIDNWLASYLGAEASTYSAGVGSRWLISAVARVFEPGCKVDCVLIFEGVQGLGKSTAFSILGGEWFTDSELPIGSKDAYQGLRGQWLIELGELSALSRADLNRVKQFITSSVDVYRPSFGRHVVNVPRQCIFGGSTNKDRYLTDGTGGRRFWPVRCTRIDLEALRRDRDQLWAESVVRYRAGARWHVDTPELRAACELEQEERRLSDPWEAPISKWLTIEMPRIRENGVTTADVFAQALQIEPAKRTRADEMRIAEILQLCGWTKGKRRRASGTLIRPYYPGLDVRLGQVGTEVGTSPGTEK